MFWSKLTSRESFADIVNILKKGAEANQSNNLILKKLFSFSLIYLIHKKKNKTKTKYLNVNVNIKKNVDTDI